MNYELNHNDFKRKDIIYIIYIYVYMYIQSWNIYL